MKITKARQQWRIWHNGGWVYFKSYDDAAEYVKIHSTKKLWDTLASLSAEPVEVPQFRFTKPTALCFLSDLHIGSSGVDYAQLRTDAETIAKTDGMHAIFHGDGIDNWIIPKLAPLQRGQAVPFDDEWALFRLWLDTLGTKLMVVVAGNHDNWTRRMGGIDFLGHLTRPIALYDDEQIMFDVSIGKKLIRICVRHKWCGHSIYNPTHGIERAARDIDADIYVGGHYHIATLARWFTVRERDRLAIITSTYKTSDAYQRTLGLPPSQHRGACAVVIDPHSADLMFFRDLKSAARFLTYIRQ